MSQTTDFILADSIDTSVRLTLITLSILFLSSTCCTGFLTTRSSLFVLGNVLPCYISRKTRHRGIHLTQIPRQTGSPQLGNIIKQHFSITHDIIYHVSNRSSSHRFISSSFPTGFCQRNRFLFKEMGRSLCCSTSRSCREELESWN